MSASTIVNCFKKVGFIREADVTVEPQEAGFDLILECMRKLPAELNSDIFVSCDNDVETSGLLIDQDIVSLHLVPDDHEEIEESCVWCNRTIAKVCHIHRQYRVNSNLIPTTTNRTHP